jgi:hypothetical protein
MKIFAGIFVEVRVLLDRHYAARFGLNPRLVQPTSWKPLDEALMSIEVLRQVIASRRSLQHFVAQSRPFFKRCG